MRRLREESNITTYELAECARRYGVRWTASSVSQIEAGKYKASIANVIVLCCAIGELVDSEIGAVDLFVHDNAARLTDRMAISNASLRKFLSGKPISMDDLQATPEYQQELDESFPLSLRKIAETLANYQDSDHPQVSLVLLLEVSKASTEADHRVARSMGLEPLTFASWCAHLWGQTFTAERDSRSGAEANAQKRGRVSRALKREIEEARRRGNNQ